MAFWTEILQIQNVIYFHFVFKTFFFCKFLVAVLEHELVESEDHVEVNGIIFNKPFVEKPVSAEDHNIYIYYPTSAGGGSQRLFRKVKRSISMASLPIILLQIGSRSSVYSPESRVRKTGSFIYEDFMPTDGKLFCFVFFSFIIFCKKIIFKELM